MALVLLLAITLAAVTVEMEPAQYVAGMVEGRVPCPLLLPLLFFVAGGIAFATGSSWGTFGIMLPIAVPVATALGLPVTPFVAAVLSGGIFGDHCEPDQRHDDRLVAGLRVRPHRARPDAASVRPAGRCGCDRVRAHGSVARPVGGSRID